MKENYVSLKAEMFHFEKWIPLTDSEILKATFNDLIKKSGFTIVNFTEHFFPIHGYTCVWVLAESHLAIHTFPQKNTSYIQISSCNQKKLKNFKNLINYI